MDLKKIKDILGIIGYGLFALMMIVFSIQYLTTDWEVVSDSFVQSVEELGKIISCEIDYKDFHYKGICSDAEMIFQYATNMTRCENGI